MSPASSPRKLLRVLLLFLAYGQFGLVGIIDCALVAPLGTTPLAAVGFASMVLAPFFVFCTGIALALAPRVAREEAAAAGDHRGATLLLLSCLRVQTLLAVASIAVLLGLAGRLDIFAQPAAVTATAPPYVLGMLFSLLPICVFAALREYAVALGHGGSAAFYAIFALAAKALLGTALVHGAGPIQAFGLIGAPLSSGLALGGGTILFGLDLWRRGRLTAVRQAFTALAGEPVFANDLFSEGLAVALQQLFELGAYYFAGIMAGWLGTTSLAAHTIGLNVANGAALLSLAVSQTTAAEVGRHAHHGHVGSGRAVRVGTATTLVLMSLVGAAVIAKGTSLFSSAEEHMALAPLLALSLIGDGLQISLGGALRGLRDARYLSVVTFICWWFIWLPVAYTLAFVLDFGIYGLWAALCATLLLCGAILALRVVRRLSALQPARELPPPDPTLALDAPRETA